MSAKGGGIEEGNLAGRRPARLTPLYHKHVSLGAKMTEREGWLLPESYRGVEEEVSGALESVGLAEESADTKIDIRGTEIGAFFTQFLKINEGPERPGQVSVRPASGGWEGVPIRHLCRLAKDHALLVLDGSKSLSTNSPIRVENPRAANPRVYLTNVTSVFAGVTLVGPNSSQILRKLTDLETSSQDPTSSACAEGPVAGIQALMVRSALPLGEDSVHFYEIYFGRDFAEYLWNAMIDAGREHGIVPIGKVALGSIRDRTSMTLPPKGRTL